MRRMDDDAAMTTALQGIEFGDKRNRCSVRYFQRHWTNSFLWLAVRWSRGNNPKRLILPQFMTVQRPGALLGCRRSYKGRTTLTIWIQVCNGPRNAIVFDGFCMVFTCFYFTKAKGTTVCGKWRWRHHCEANTYSNDVGIGSAVIRWSKFN